MLSPKFRRIGVSRLFHLEVNRMTKLLSVKKRANYSHLNRRRSARGYCEENSRE